MSEPGILLLAAGQGKRYKLAGGVGHKLLAPCLFDDGQAMPLVEVALRHAIDSLLPVHLVTLPTSTEILAIASRYPCSVTTFASQGMGESVAAGVRETSAWSGWLIQPADMPSIFPQDYQRLSEALRTHSQVRMSWQNRPGHPVGFSAIWHGALSELTKDRGACQLLSPHDLKILPSHEGVVTDWDVPQVR